MSLWSKAGMRDVLKNLVDGLSVQWTRLSQYWKVPNSTSITEARQRLGSQVMRQLFEQVVHPMATPETQQRVSRRIARDDSRWHVTRCAVIVLPMPVSSVLLALAMVIVPPFPKCD